MKQALIFVPLLLSGFTFEATLDRVPGSTADMNQKHASLLHDQEIQAPDLRLSQRLNLLVFRVGIKPETTSA
jgi:hypothetical protein